MLFGAVADGEYDVVFFTEAWLSSKHLDVDFFPSQYVVFCSDRLYVAGVVECGGGVLITMHYFNSAQASICICQRFNL